jgi:hypothetical protein
MVTKRNQVETVSQRILFIRGQKVIFDRDLAEMYGAPTKVLNQAEKRNVERFPFDFMFQLSKADKVEVVTNCDHLNKLKFSSILPFVFTEQGTLMLGKVLKSTQAIEVSLWVVRAFIQLRGILSTNKEVIAKLLELERKVSSHDQAIAGLIDAIWQLMQSAVAHKRSISFTANTAGNKKST